MIVFYFNEKADDSTPVSTRISVRGCFEPSSTPSSGETGTQPTGTGETSATPFEGSTPSSGATGTQTTVEERTGTPGNGSTPSVATPSTVSSRVSTTPVACVEIDGMDEDVSSENIVPSSSVDEGENLRPGSDSPWTSEPSDDTPSVTLTFTSPTSLINSIDLPGVSNVDSVTLSFVPEDSNTSGRKFDVSELPIEFETGVVASELTVTFEKVV